MSKIPILVGWFQRLGHFPIEIEIVPGILVKGQHERKVFHRGVTGALGLESKWEVW